MKKFSDLPQDQKIDIEKEIYEFIDSLEGEPNGPNNMQRRWVKEKARSLMYDQFGSLAIKAAFYTGALFALNNIQSDNSKPITGEKQP